MKAKLKDFEAWFNKWAEDHPVKATITLLPVAAVMFVAMLAAISLVFFLLLWFKWWSVPIILAGCVVFGIVPAVKDYNAREQ